MWKNKCVHEDISVCVYLLYGPVNVRVDLEPGGIPVSRILYEKKINRKPLVVELNGIKENIGFWVLFQSRFHQNGSGIINM